MGKPPGRRAGPRAWEIACPSPAQPTLGERNLLVRVVHEATLDNQAPASQPMELAPDEPMRVLFVFAEARGSHPFHPQWTKVGPFGT